VFSGIISPVPGPSVLKVYPEENPVNPASKSPLVMRLHPHGCVWETALAIVRPD